MIFCIHFCFFSLLNLLIGYVCMDNLSFLEQFSSSYPPPKKCQLLFDFIRWCTRLFPHPSVFLWHLRCLFLRHLCLKKKCMDWKPYPQLTEFLHECGNYLLMDKNACCFSSGVSVWDTVTVVAVCVSARWKQTGQGQLCFPLEK